MGTGESILLSFEGAGQMVDMKTTAVLCILTILAVGATAFGQSWTVTQLTNNSSDDFDPQVSGNNVVWTGPNGSGYTNVFKYDGNSITQLTNVNFDEAHARVSGDKVAWHRDEDPGPWLGAQIYLHDGAAIAKLTVGEKNVQPVIYGANVVWKATVMDTHILKLHDGTSDRSVASVVWDQGETISGYKLSDSKLIYRVNVPGFWSRLHYQDIASQSTITLSDNATGQQALSGVNVVWTEEDPNAPGAGNHEVMLYDGSTTTALTNNSVEERNPQISGTNVVWEQWDGNDWEIILYDGNSIAQLTNNAYDDTNPQIDGAFITWQGSDGSDTEIFAYDGAIVTQVTNNSTNDELPQVSGSTIVWRGHDGTDWEIFKAQPDSPSPHTLTVLSGSGGGTYTTGELVAISANAPPTGMGFDKWTGDTAGIVDINASSTSIIMSGVDATIIATYAYRLTVISGSGSGAYTAGVMLSIVADAPINKCFDQWVGDTVGIADTSAASTTLTMPAADATITATYTPSQLMAWGFDIYGQVSDTPSCSGFTAIAAGSSHGLALDANGSIHAWGYDYANAVSDTPSGSGFTAIAAGSYGGLALDANGSIVAWGMDYYGRVSDTPSGSGFTAIAAGGYHNIALDANGAIVAWGRDNYGQVSDTPSGSGFTAIAAGHYHNIALDANGAIHAWGYNYLNVVSDTPSSVGFTAIASGSFHNLSLDANGAIVAWGKNDDGQVSNTPSGNGFTAIAGGSDHSLALDANGAIISWGDDHRAQVSNTPSGSGFMAIAAGSMHSLAIHELDQPLPECWSGDLNEDQVVDITDLNMVLIDWSKSGAAITDSRSDTNSDGTVDITDLNNVLIDWGKTGYKP